MWLDIAGISATSLKIQATGNRNRITNFSNFGNWTYGIYRYKTTQPHVEKFLSKQSW